jgi:PPP family 3-phenylpropionic acid transporter
VLPGGTALASLGLLALSQLTHAITFAGHHSACIQLVQRYFPDRLRGRGQALYSTLGYGFSGVLGGIGGGWLIESSGYTPLFLVAASAGGLAWWCAVRAEASDARTRF